MEWRRGGEWIRHPLGPWDDRSVADGLAAEIAAETTGTEARVVEAKP